MKITNYGYKAVIALTMLVLLGLPGASWAQTARPDGGTISQTPGTTSPERELPERENIPGLGQGTTTAPGAELETINVRDFRLQDVEFIDEAELQSVLAPYKGRELTLAQIEEAAAHITQLYQERGYILTRAYIPQQDARDGILTIAILAGRYGELNIDNQSLVADSFIANTFKRLEPGKVAKRSDLERKMLLVGDLPGAATPALAVAPGQAFGTADLGISIPHGDRFNGYVTLDNQGSRYTGRYRLGAGLDINSLMGAGDKLSFSAVGTDELGDGLLNGRFAFSTPLGYDGLRAELAVDRTTYELNKEYRDLDAIGQTDSIRGTLSYPIIRNQNQNLWLSVSGAYKYIKDEIKVFDETLRKHAWTGSSSVQYERWTRVFGEYRLYTSAGLGFTYGHLQIPNKIQRDLNKAGADTVGNFAYVNFNFMANYAFTQKLSLNVTFNAQQSLNSKNLDGSEQFIITGPGGVRAYRESISGDNGYFINGELRYQLPGIADGLRHSLGLFSGMGYSRYADGDYVVSNGNRIYDAGLGYYANYGNYFAKVQMAHIIGARPDGMKTSGRTHVVAQIGLTF